MNQLKLVAEQLHGSSGARAVWGKVLAVKGSLIQANLPGAALGDFCHVATRSGKIIPAQLVSFYEDIVSLAPFLSLEGVHPGSKVFSSGERLRIPVSEQMLGRVVDALGQPIDSGDGEASSTPVGRELFTRPPECLSRRLIDTQLITGVSGIDLLCPIGAGQRLGLIAGAGVGKSTLLGMIARNTNADVTVIALVGERGREVNEFLEESLGGEARSRSVVVVATSDEASSRRMAAAYTATAIAEFFRDQGLRVLLLVDSLTRMARAIREVGLADGELPVRHGYTATVYTELPRLIERSGTNHCGSITAIYTLLSSAEDEEDPLAEEAKSVLDGHLVLSNKIAVRGIRPALDYTRSISRLTQRLFTDDDMRRREALMRILARLNQDRDIVLLGGVPDPELQTALDLEHELLEVVTQKPHSKISHSDSIAAADRFLERFQERLRARSR